MNVWNKYLSITLAAGCITTSAFAQQSSVISTTSTEYSAYEQTSIELTPEDGLPSIQTLFSRQSQSIEERRTAFEEKMIGHDPAQTFRTTHAFLEIDSLSLKFDATDTCTQEQIDSIVSLGDDFMEQVKVLYSVIHYSSNLQSRGLHALEFEFWDSKNFPLKLSGSIWDTGRKTGSSDIFAFDMTSVMDENGQKVSLMSDVTNKIVKGSQTITTGAQNGYLEIIQGDGCRAISPIQIRTGFKYVEGLYSVTTQDLYDFELETLKGLLVGTQLPTAAGRQFEQLANKLETVQTELADALTKVQNFETESGLPAIAEELEELKKQSAEQGLLIEELKAELEQVDQFFIDMGLVDKDGNKILDSKKGQDLFRQMRKAESALAQLEFADQITKKNLKAAEKLATDPDEAAKVRNEIVEDIFKARSERKKEEMKILQNEMKKKGIEFDKKELNKNLKAELEQDEKDLDADKEAPTDEDEAFLSKTVREFLAGQNNQELSEAVEIATSNDKNIVKATNEAEFGEDNLTWFDYEVSQKTIADPDKSTKIVRVKRRSRQGRGGFNKRKYSRVK